MELRLEQINYKACRVGCLHASAILITLEHPVQAKSTSASVEGSMAGD